MPSPRNIGCFDGIQQVESLQHGFLKKTAVIKFHHRDLGRKLIARAIQSVGNLLAIFPTPFQQTFAQDFVICMKGDQAYPRKPVARL
jgi:hypothetical protein